MSGRSKTTAVSEKPPSDPGSQRLSGGTATVVSSFRTRGSRTTTGGFSPTATKPAFIADGSGSGRTTVCSSTEDLTEDLSDDLSESSPEDLSDALSDELEVREEVSEESTDAGECSGSVGAGTSTALGGSTTSGTPVRSTSATGSGEISGSVGAGTSTALTGPAASGALTDDGLSDDGLTDDDALTPDDGSAGTCGSVSMASSASLEGFGGFGAGTSSTRFGSDGAGASGGSTVLAGSNRRASDCRTIVRKLRLADALCSFSPFGVWLYMPNTSSPRPSKTTPGSLTLIVTVCS